MDLQASCFFLCLLFMSHKISMIEKFLFKVILSIAFVCDTYEYFVSYCVKTFVTFTRLFSRYVLLKNAFQPCCCRIDTAGPVKQEIFNSVSDLAYSVQTKNSISVEQSCAALRCIVSVEIHLYYSGVNTVILNGLLKKRPSVSRIPKPSRIESASITENVVSIEKRSLLSVIPPCIESVCITEKIVSVVETASTSIVPACVENVCNTENILPVEKLSTTSIAESCIENVCITEKVVSVVKTSSTSTVPAYIENVSIKEKVVSLVKTSPKSIVPACIENVSGTEKVVSVVKTSSVKSVSVVKSNSYQGCNVFKRFRKQETQICKMSSAHLQHENTNKVSNEFNDLLSFIDQTPIANETCATVYDPYMENVMAVVSQPQFGGTLTPDMLPHPILEHLDFKKYLGGGAYGRVYSALQMSTQEIITLKIVENNAMSLDEVKFMDELREHKNIVEITWAHQLGNFIYIAMKNHGENIVSLSKFVSKFPQLDEDMLSVIGRQVANGISFMNSKGIAHMDLKEDNCIINERLEVRIIDFGMSLRCRLVDIEEPHYRYGGTQQYMSPECVQETGYYGPEVDAWSIGVMMYYMFVGAYPFSIDVYGKLELPYTRKFPNPRRMMSDELNDLLERLFEVNIFTRMTSQQAIYHPFFTKYVTLDEKYLTPFYLQ